MDVIEAWDGATLRFGYASPRSREQATERQFLLLDSMEAGLARASMSMAGCGRLGALLRVEGPEIEGAALVAALAELRERHALLRRTLRRTSLGLALAPCDVASTVAVAFVDEDDGWRAAWREIEALPLREGNPLVSVYVLKQRRDPRRADVILVIEHVIADGASLVSLAKEMLELLAPSESSDVASTTCVETFPPTVVTMAAARVGGTLRGIVRVGRSITRLLARDIGNPHVRLPRTPGTRFAECHTHIAHRDLDAEFYGAIFARARSENVSVAATLMAAVSLAFAERERRERADQTTFHVLSHVTVDLRSRYASRIAHGDLGVHVSTIDPCVQITTEQLERADDRSLFEIARAFRGEIRELLRSGVDRHFLGALVAGAGILLPRLVPDTSFGSFIFTDAATFAIPARLGAFDVRFVSALANCRAQSLPYVVTTRSAHQTRISMMAPTPAFSPADVEAVLDDAIGYLRTALRPA